MIKIKSTEKLATSNTKGLCDVTREMVSYKEDLKTGRVTIVVVDKLIQEKNSTRTVTQQIDGNDVDVEINVIERVVIETRQPIPFTFDSNTIDAMFSSLGTTISKTKSYTEQQNTNKTTILIAQTVQGNGWQGMTNWIADTEHLLVSEFSE